MADTRHSIHLGVINSDSCKVHKSTSIILLHDFPTGSVYVVILDTFQNPSIIDFRRQSHFRHLRLNRMNQKILHIMSLFLRQLNITKVVMPDPVSGTGQARSGIQSLQ
jgi:hypothetical protein